MDSNRQRRHAGPRGSWRKTHGRSQGQQIQRVTEDWDSSQRGESTTRREMTNGSSEKESGARKTHNRKVEEEAIDGLVATADKEAKLVAKRG